MIRVNKEFYESGCTMDGKGNRVFLKGTKGKADIEMIFKGDTVEILGWYHVPSYLYFNEIEEICVAYGTKGPFPNIKLR